MISSTPWKLTSNTLGSRAITATVTGPLSCCAAVTSSRVSSRSSPRRCSATIKVPFMAAQSLQPLLDDLPDPPCDVGRTAGQDLRPLTLGRREHAADPVGGLALLSRRHDLDRLLLGLLDRPQVRVARLVDAGLNRQQSRRVDLRDVEEAALQLAPDRGATGTRIPLDPRHDGDTRKVEELRDRCPRRRLPPIPRLHAAEDEVRRFALRDRREQPRNGDRVGRPRIVDSDRPIGSHRETASHRILDLSAADGEDDDLVALAAEFLPDAQRLLSRVRVPLVEREVEVVRIDIARIPGELDLVAQNCDLFDANDDLHAAAPPSAPLYHRKLALDHSPLTDVRLWN